MSWLENMHEELGKVDEYFNPKSVGKSPNWKLIETTGGTENVVGETVGETVTETEFWAIEDEPENEEKMRAGAGDEQEVITLWVESDTLSMGDRVIRASDSTPFRVVELTNEGGSTWDLGQRALVKELTD